MPLVLLSNAVGASGSRVARAKREKNTTAAAVSTFMDCASWSGLRVRLNCEYHRVMFTANGKKARPFLERKWPRNGTLAPWPFLTSVMSGDGQIGEILLVGNACKGQHLQRAVGRFDSPTLLAALSGRQQRLAGDPRNTIRRNRE